MTTLSIKWDTQRTNPKMVHALQYKPNVNKNSQGKNPKQKNQTQMHGTMSLKEVTRRSFR